MLVVVKAPKEYESYGARTVFLAGSIEMGKAEDWQTKFAAGLGGKMDLVLLNPRRDDWDSSWKQDIANDNFREQVLWELKALEDTDVIAMYFDPKTQSPISLLELGLFANSGKLVVCCPEGFWRKGNVDIVCRRYGVEQVATLEDLIKTVKERLQTRD